MVLVRESGGQLVDRMFDGGRRDGEDWRVGPEGRRRLGGGGATP